MTQVETGFCLPADNRAQQAALAQMPLTELWGIAKRMASRLEEIGIRTPLDLRDADSQFLRRRFGVVMQRMGLELRGISCLPLSLAVPDRKSIVSSRSFGALVRSKGHVEEAVRSFAARAAAKMRGQGLACGTLSVFLETNPFRPQDPQYNASQSIALSVSTAETGKLIAAAQTALRAVCRDGYLYKRAGVMLLHLEKAATVSPGLFDQPDSGRIAGADEDGG